MSKIIGISGASGSGKSTFSKELLSMLPKSYYISADKYYKKELPTIISPLDGETYPDWNHPSAIDFLGVVKEINEVKDNYDFILVDGAFIFCIPEISELLDCKVFIDASIEMRLFRRISRNVLEKNQSIEFIGGYYLKCVRYREKEFSLASAKYADVIVNNENGFIPKVPSIADKLINGQSLASLN